MKEYEGRKCRKENGGRKKKRRISKGVKSVEEVGLRICVITSSKLFSLILSSSTCDPSSMILGWKNQPKHVLIIRKPGDDNDVNKSFKELAYWLVKVLLEKNF